MTFKKLQIEDFKLQIDSLLNLKSEIGNQK